MFIKFMFPERISFYECEKFSIYRCQDENGEDKPKRRMVVMKSQVGEWLPASTQESEIEIDINNTKMFLMNNKGQTIDRIFG